MTHYDLVAANKRKSVAVVAGFTLFVMAVGYVFSRAMNTGVGGVGLALIVAGCLSFFSYYFSDRMILALSGAHPATRDKYFDFYTVTENIASSQRLPMPLLYVIDDSAPNAFATGRNPEHAIVCATTGLLSKLDRGEIEGVVAHELSHIKNYDMLLMSLVTIMVGFVALLSDWFWHVRRFTKSDDSNSGQAGAIFFAVGVILALLSPLIAQLIQLAISRRREFFADASAVAMTKNPQGLITALQKISADREPLEAANKATAHLYFSNPLNNAKGGVGWFANLFNTHPPVEDRILALQKII